MLSVAEWVISAVLIVVALVMIIIVLFQQSDDDGLSGAIGGSSSAYDSYLGKNEGRTVEFISQSICDADCAVSHIFFEFTDNGKRRGNYKKTY